MNSELNTAHNTALLGGTPLGTAAKPILEEAKHCLTQAKLKAEKRKPGRERGIWKEHGTFAASAGKDPVTGKRVREHGFGTIREAKEWRAKKIAEITEVRTGRRTVARSITEGESVDAVEALDLLKNAGFRDPGLLMLVAKDYIARHPEAVPTTVGEFYKTWIALKIQQDCRGHTISSAKYTFSVFRRAFNDVPLTAIKLPHIEAFVFDPKLPNPTTRRGRGVVVTNFFNDAQLRGLIGSEPRDHPCFGLVLPPKPEGEPDPWPINDFETLFRFAWKTEDQFRCSAYILLGGYEGIRTEELLRMWFGPDCIDIDEGVIIIGPEVAKKRRQRTITMEPELQAALKALRDRPFVRPKYWRPLPRPPELNSSVVSKKLLGAFKNALLTPIAEGGAGLPIVDVGGKVHRSKNGKVTITQPSAWHDNGLRSSFATFHFERDNDARLTSAIMGHTGKLDVFFNYYRSLAKRGEGKAFFAIAAKVIKEFT